MPFFKTGALYMPTRFLYKSIYHYGGRHVKKKLLSLKHFHDKRLIAFDANIDRYRKRNDSTL